MTEFEPEYSIRRGRQHYAMNVEDTPHESVTGLHNYLVKKSPFNYMGFDYYLSAVPNNMPDSARIDVFAPMLDTGRNADKLWSGERIRYYEDLGIDEYDYDYGKEEDSPYIMQNPILHDIEYNTKWGEHYEYDTRFRDDHPEEMLKYENRESDFINEPGAAYEWAWRERYNDLKNEMDKLGKLFGIEGILINRYPDRPWMRQADSYGNQNIRPGEKVPRKITEQEEPETDDFSDEEIDKRKSYDSDNEVDNTPFTPLEVRILNTLHKYLTRSDLQSLSQETPPEYGEVGKKFWDIMKIFGITPVNTEQDTRTSKYAKWALDNWTEEGDYGNIENPHKVLLGWYQVDREESGSQVEYKDGSTEVLGFDEDDAGQRGDYNFWDWGGEMETNDYGDYETYDSEIVGTEFLRMDEGLARVLREDRGKQKIQDLLFQFWMRKNIGPTLDPDKLKLIGFDMHSEEDKILVYNNLIEYYGDEELENIVHERLEGVHDADYQFSVTSYDSLTPRPYKTEARGLETYVDVIINGDQIIPISQEDGTVRDMTVWEANEKAAQEQQENPYDDAYEGIREEIQYYLNDVILQNLPIEAQLDYVDFSEPGSFEAYAQESLPKSAIEMITEDDDGYIDDMVYIDEPREKHIRRMGKGLGSLVGFPLDKYKNMPPPENESDTTEEEIEYLEEIPVDKNLVDSADEIRQHFKNFLSPKGLEYPKEEMKEVMQGVKAIILILKYYYNRPRPWQIADAKGLELNSETLQSSSSPSYPSGHATQGRFVALYLSDLYPEYRDELMQIGEDIAFSRNMAKVHYPSDSAFGKLLGDDMYDYVNQPQLEPEMIHETIMDDIPLEQFREDKENLNEHKESKLNPQLMMGDEIMVVSTEGVHDFGAPELFKPYVVVGIKHGTTMNREIHKWTHDEDEEQTPDRWDSPEVPRSRLGFRKEFDTIPYTYYQIEPIGMTDEDRTGAMLAGGGRMKPMYIFPSPSEYRGSDQWILRPGFLRGELNEHKEETGLNPELTYGDKILVIDIDREVESDTIKYNIPEPELRPEKFIPYTVVDKESNGHQSRWPFRYTLVLVDQLEEYEKSLDSGYGDYETYEKLLYPWIHQWIPADTPTANKVDRLTITEHQETKVSPDLEVGEVIRVLGVDGEHARMPDKWGVYKVQDIKQDNATQEIYYDIVPYPDPELPDMDYMEFHKETKVRSDQYWYRHGKTLYRGDIWIYADVDRVTLNEHEEELNQPLTMGDVIRVVDVDKEATYKQPTYPYDTGNASGNSLMTNHHRGQIHGQDTYPHPMRLYAVMSKSLYRTKDRDYLNPYWMLWPVDKDGKVEAIKDFHEIIMTEKDTWMTVKKHHSNIPGDIEAQQKEYDDSGRNFILQPQIVEQVMMKKGEMLKSDIITFLTNRFILGSTDYSELKDNKGNYYRIIDMKDPYEHVTLSDLLEPAIEFVSLGIKSGDFNEEDMNTALTAITNWVSLEMNQKKEYLN